MRNSNLLKKSLALFIAAIVLAAVFSVAMPEFFARSEAAYAQSPEEIYYSDDAYSGGAVSTTETETFTYATSQATSASVNNTFPDYYNSNTSLENCCANVAGANLIGFYDRYYAELIPDCTPGVARGTGYSYYSMLNNTQLRQNVINDLYTRMSTNNPLAGTSQSQYKAGMTSYVGSKSRSITFTSVMTNGALDMTKVATAINAGIPVSMYWSGYNFSQVIESDNEITIVKYQFTGNHIAIVYGYQTVNYYDANNALIKTKTYLYASSGMETVTGRYILNNNGVINDAESSQIS